MLIFIHHLHIIAELQYCEDSDHNLTKLQL